ncbi:hypothetical protein ABZP36_032738 [Zizania latifolia]
MAAALGLVSLQTLPPVSACAWHTASPPWPSSLASAAPAVKLQPRNRVLPNAHRHQGLLKNEGKERYGVLGFWQWQKKAANFSIDRHYPVQELWDGAQNCWERILAHEGKSLLVAEGNIV